jgi:O-antigen biosynthesis protein
LDEFPVENDARARTQMDVNGGGRGRVSGLRSSAISMLRGIRSVLPPRWVAAARRCLAEASAHMPHALRYRLHHLLGLMGPVGEIERDYPAWIELYDRVDADRRRAIMTEIARMSHPPLISILMPVFDPDPEHLRAAIRSVEDQVYPLWELCIADDASTAPAVIDILREAATREQRVKLLRRERNGHISAASNSALGLATGSFVALLDHDDVLPAHTLFEVASAIVAQPNVDLIYTDEDHIDDQGRRSCPYFKPDWNPELMLGQNLINHLGVYRRSLVERVGGFQIGMEGSQDYDLALRVVAETKPDRIMHIPRILYHWRQASRTRSFSEQALERCAENGRRAVSAFLAPKMPDVKVQPATGPSWNRVIYPLPHPEPLVSVIIPTRNHANLLARVVNGLLVRTDYAAMEIVIVDNDTDEPAALKLLAQLERDSRIRVLRHPGPFNYSVLNNRAVRESAGELILLLNNDIDVIDAGWLREMVSHAVRPGIGAVGAKLLYPNGTIQHGGVSLGAGGVAGHQYLHRSRGDLGYFGQLALVRNVSAVTGACLLVRRDAFLEVDGLDEVSLPVAFNDVDLCLKLVERGYRNVWTPYAELYHHESSSRGSDLVGEKAARFKREVAVMRQRWGHVLDRDPCGNPNLSLHASDVALAFPPRTGFEPPRQTAREDAGRLDPVNPKEAAD